MAKDKKLIPIEGKGKFSFSKDAFREFKKNFAMNCEFVVMMAEITRIKFDALKAQGFTDAQALELSKTVF